MNYNTAKQILQKTKVSFNMATASSAINKIVTICGKDALLSYLKEEDAFGKICTDGHGAAYLIPDGMTSQFYEMLDRIEVSEGNYDAQEKAAISFDDAFEKYRLSGGISSLKIPMED